MARARDFDAAKQPLAAILEQLPDGTTCRAGLLIPQAARRIVREFRGDTAITVFENVDDAVLVDFPFRNLMFESRVVQRLYYGMEDLDVPAYAKVRSADNNLMLLDPIRLISHFDERMNSVKRQLLMRCFSTEIWIAFFKMVSLGIGERLRAIYAASVEPVVDDAFLASLESLQLTLVGVTSRITNGNPRGYTMEDIETIVLKGCSEALLKAQNIKGKWNTVVEKLPVFGELIMYLSQFIAKVQALVAPEAGNADTNNDDRIDVIELRDTCKNIVAFASKAASDLSIVKLQMLEHRHNLFQKLGTFEPLSAEVFRKGIQSSGFSQDQIVPLLILSHCMEAYGIREWCIRFVVEQLKTQLHAFIENTHEVGQTKQNQSAFFRTAGAVVPVVEDFLFLIPCELLEYISKLNDITNSC
ncbi:hypothetical protein X943_001374 [Babesia divergens]|uniref:Uncharacterized protein n=1 Tax=Babesia divergens TaxID=32595 RepID=A0AAD9G9J3_BABDI|nr:hypothetical protein X943_001374 [Babesia divergens]